MKNLDKDVSEFIIGMIALCILSVIFAVIKDLLF